MKKFRAYFIQQSSSPKEILGDFETKQEAIDACIKKTEHDYCLDNEADRRLALEQRGFCICGCGPRQIEVEEIDC